MKTGMKAFYLALTMVGASACYPAHAAVTPAKSDTSQAAALSTGKAAAKDPAQKAAVAKIATTPDDDAVSINNGSAEELANSMSGIGIKKAQAIISYRDEYGPFKTLEQLQEVPGISGTLVERNRTNIKL